MSSVFIDGQAGTTGLQIASRLAARDDIELLEIPEAERKHADAKKQFYDAADVVILCLPDDAAREAVLLAPDARVLDASTAHRTAKDWVYGMPELDPAQRGAIRDAKLVSNPGCYPTGFILLIRPLIDAKILSPSVPLRIHAISGFSGGGKKLISKYQERDDDAWQTRPYALDLQHKHIPEMRHYAGTGPTPLFVPMVGHFYKGMLVQVPLFFQEFDKKVDLRDIHAILKQRYASEVFVDVLPLGAADALDEGFISPTACNDSNRIELMVFGNGEHVVLSARYDNLGKGASGAAVQNLNLMLGLDECAGLHA